MASQAISDDELHLRKRARRRLIGAGTLVLLSVIILPMVLDSEPQPLGRDVEIRIPEKNGDNFASRVVPLDNSVVVEEVVKELPAPAAAVAPASQPLVPAKATDKAVAKPAETKIAEKKTEPVSKPAAVAEKPASKPVVTEPAAKPAAGTEKFVVQLGVFSSSENAKQLQTKLSGLGLKTYTQQVKTASGEQVRVRMGPYTSRAEAEKVRDKIKAQQLNAVIMPLQ